MLVCIKGAMERAKRTTTKKKKLQIIIAMNGKSHMLRFTTLLFIMAAANTLEGFQPTLDAGPNSRSKRESMLTSSSVIEYMERLRNSLTDEEGRPKLESPEDPTEIWGMQDIGEFFLA